MAKQRLIPKWARWLERIGLELIELLVQQKHFNDLLVVIEPYAGQETGAEVSRWIAQGYYAYACLCVRRMTEGPSRKPPPPKGDPKLTVSLVVLLEELASNHTLLTRDRLRRLYRRHMRNLPYQVAVETADAAFDEATRTSALNEIPVSRIRQDVTLLKESAKRVNRRVNKVYAHTERDRRRIGKPVRRAEIDKAISTLVEIHRHYTLLIQGRDVRHILPEDDVIDIRNDLRKIWPIAGDENEATHP